MTSILRKTGMGLLAVMTLASCSNSAKSTLGFTKAAPDEFRVIAKSPLTVPPDFSLRPPLKNAVPPKDEAEVQAKDVLLGQAASTENVNAVSPGEEILLGKAAVKGADPAIRQVLEQDNTPPPPKEKSSLLKKILPSDAKEKTMGPDGVVDASAEKARLERNKKEGKPVTEGETPTIMEKPTALDKLLGKDKKADE